MILARLVGPVAAMAARSASSEMEGGSTTVAVRSGKRMSGGATWYSEEARRAEIASRTDGTQLEHERPDRESVSRRGRGELSTMSVETTVAIFEQGGAAMAARTSSSVTEEGKCMVARLVARSKMGSTESVACSEAVGAPPRSGRTAAETALTQV